jgi:2'-5' RNA ligase
MAIHPIAGEPGEVRNDVTDAPTRGRRHHGFGVLGEQLRHATPRILIGRNMIHAAMMVDYGPRRRVNDMNVVPTESGLVIPVPALDEFVQRWRPLTDAIPVVGVPAHVTVLYPWVPPPVPSQDLERLQGLLSGVEAIDFTLTDVRRFGTDVVYVAPEPAAPFTALTQLVWEAWPDWPPYEGEFDEPVPHVTIGHGGAEEHLISVGEAARELLPITVRAEEVWLMTGGWDPAVWSVAGRYPLGTV